jgi:hypothetical protein
VAMKRRTLPDCGLTACQGGELSREGTILAEGVATQLGEFVRF